MQSVIAWGFGMPEQRLAPPPTDEEIKANKAAELFALLVSASNTQHRQPNWLAADPFADMEGYEDVGGFWRKRQG